jgi:hypothetical protein
MCSEMRPSNALILSADTVTADTAAAEAEAEAEADWGSCDSVFWGARGLSEGIRQADREHISTVQVEGVGVVVVVVGVEVPEVVVPFSGPKVPVPVLGPVVPVSVLSWKSISAAANRAPRRRCMCGGSEEAMEATQTYRHTDKQTWEKGNEGIVGNRGGKE